jgi:glycosyltransferase involved in cell wall biosynthesis
VVEVIRRAEGGMKEHYITLVKGLSHMGFDVLAACNFSQKTLSRLENDRIHLYKLELEDDIRLFGDLAAIFRLYRKIKLFCADVVHCHGFKAGMVGRIAAFFARCPSVYTVHNFMPQSVMTGGKFIILRLIEQILALCTHRIITVSQALKNEITDKFGLSGDLIKVVRNGTAPLIQSSEANVRGQWGIAEDCVLIGCIARLIPSKGINYLIDAIPPLLKIKPNVMLLVAGDGPILETLKNQARYLSLEDKVIFTGFVENAGDYLNAFDIFVLPSLMEGLGISIIEAMMAGKPVIASRTGGIPEIVRDEVTGSLVEPGNPNEIKEALLKLIQNPELMKIYAENGRKHAMENFGIQKMLDETAEILDGSNSRG